jgi:sec-independent protein translocase protein TatA
MDLGMPEILVIVVIALLLFGPSKLPGLGKSMGEAIRGFKKGLKETEDAVQDANPNQTIITPVRPVKADPQLTHEQKNYTSQSSNEETTAKTSVKTDSHEDS